MTTIGLFGTCGTTTWRNAFIAEYEKQGIAFFNPQKENWTPEDAQIEAEHLLTDDIVLFPVTNETYGTGSLAEIGFSVCQTMKSDKMRYIVVFIAPDLIPELEDNKEARKASIQARVLTKAHLANVKDERVFIVSSLEEMLELSLILHKSITLLNQARAICKK